MRKKPRIDADPSTTAISGGRTPQIMDREMPQEAIDGMFHQEELASSSSNAAGWGKVSRIAAF